jgi:HSP20 family protein
MNIKNLIPFGRKNIAVSREVDNLFLLMQREMNRLFDTFSGTWGLGSFPTLDESFSPRMDMAEDSKAFTVTAEMPGMSEKDIDVAISGDTLTIRGEKKEEKENQGRNYYYSERSYGTFSRTIPLPIQVDVDRVTANFNKGVLTIALPKTAESADAMKKIAVKTE